MSAHADEAVYLLRDGWLGGFEFLGDPKKCERESGVRRFCICVHGERGN